ncbi:MAG: glycerate kinase [Kiritimatiellae bacterium]|nr:glycerate kinase [Kiritimatiellia bacterium]
MKIVMCMDSWKGSLGAMEACRAAARGIQRALPDAEMVFSPLADGGEGTLALIAEARPGQRISMQVQGPLAHQRIEDAYLLWPESGEALIEMALCAGLPLLAENERTPLITTTYGVGEWMRDALDRGCTSITLAVGGSATVDAGMGLAQAMGWRFEDEQGRELGFGGGELVRLHRLIPPAVSPNFQLRVMCDVTNPLRGPNGAAAVFGPQKGANPEDVKRLEQGLTRFAEVVKRDLGLDIADLPGTGAAGGIPASAVACFGAELVSGVEEMMRLTGLPEKMAAADFVICGEGSVDRQSLDGKVLSGVLKAAKSTHTRVGIIAGSCTLTREELLAAGVTEAASANHQNLPLQEALAKAAVFAEEAGFRLGTRLRDEQIL